METAISINKHIYSILISDTTLNSLVGTNIFPLIAEESATFPFIIFKKDNITTDYTKDGRLFDEVEFSIMIVSNKYFDSVEIAERVRLLLECKKDEYFREIRLSSVNEDYAEDSFIQELTFKTNIG